MDSVDLIILNHLTKRENMEQDSHLIDKSLCTKESWTLFNDLKNYLDSHKDKDEVQESEFKTWFRLTAHPGWKAEQHQLYGTIISNIFNLDNDSEESSGAFQQEVSRLRVADKLKRLAGDLQKGSEFDETAFDEIRELLRQSSDQETDEDNGPVYSASLQDAYNELAKGTPLYWRCEDLNKSIGPIRKGDFIIVPKRPEIGGTSFLCSEITYMLEQLPDGQHAVIFNNEEEMRKLHERAVTCALNITGRDIYTDTEGSDKAYQKWLGDRKLDLIRHEYSSSIQDIWKQCEQQEYGVIGVNIICSSKLKLPRGQDLADHDRLQRLGAELRKLAHAFGPVIAVVQADPSAEGMAYIPQDRIYKSKTALQGEADALIFIGHEEGAPADKRHIHVAKNKMPPAPCTLSPLKHLKTDVAFDYETGRFTSLHHKGNSRYANNSS